jgi:hypothetical protein
MGHSIAALKRCVTQKLDIILVGRKLDIILVGRKLDIVPGRSLSSRSNRAISDKAAY